MTFNVYVRMVHAVDLFLMHYKHAAKEKKALCKVRIYIVPGSHCMRSLSKYIMFTFLTGSLQQFCIVDR